MDLNNKVALITGASSGIGKAIAYNLNDAGMKPILTARSEDEIKVAAIAPGTVDTGLYDKWDKEETDYIKSGRVLQSEDIARCVRFILEQPSVMIPRMLVVPTNQPV